MNKNKYNRTRTATLLILSFFTVNIITDGPWAGGTPFEIMKSNQVGGNIIGIEWKPDNTGFTFAFQKDDSGGFPAHISEIYLTNTENSYTVATNGSLNLRDPLALCFSGTSGRLVVAYSTDLLATYV